MKLYRLSDSNLRLELASTELLVLKAALREAFATIDACEFPLRIGVQSEEASVIAKELHMLAEMAGIKE